MKLDNEILTEPAVKVNYDDLGSDLDNLPDKHTDSLAYTNSISSDNNHKNGSDHISGILNNYFRDISEIPLLTRNEEIEIPTKIQNYKRIALEIDEEIDKFQNNKKNNLNEINYRKTRKLKLLKKKKSIYEAYSKELTHKFVQSNLRLVISIAKRYLNHGLPLSDLIQEGNVGLIKSIDKFDPNKGYRFSTYASWWIFQAITRALLVQTGSIKIPVYLLEKSSRVYKAKDSLMKEMGKMPTPEEIAEESGTYVSYVERILNTSTDSVSMDRYNEDLKRNLHDILADNSSQSPDHITNTEELNCHIRESLSLLSEKEEQVLRMRFGIDQDNINTLDDIGKKFRLTRERIRQIEQKALKKLSVCKTRKILKNLVE